MAEGLDRTRQREQIAAIVSRNPSRSHNPVVSVVAAHTIRVNSVEHGDDWGMRGNVRERCAVR
jgi:hypothetical protein